MLWHCNVIKTFCAVSDKGPPLLVHSHLYFKLILKWEAQHVELSIFPWYIFWNMECVAFDIKYSSYSRFHQIYNLTIHEWQERPLAPLGIQGHLCILSLTVQKLRISFVSWTSILFWKILFGCVCYFFFLIQQLDL